MEFQLKKPITISKNGVGVETHTFICNAPTGRCRFEAGAIKTAFGNAQMKGMERFAKLGIDKEELVNSLSEADRAKEEAEAKEMPKDPREVLNPLQGSLTDKEYNAFQENFIKILSKKGVCLADGTEQFTATMVDDMDYEDFERLMGEYLFNFLV